MIVKFGRFGLKAVLVWLECVAIVVGLALLAAAIFAWRLSAGPVDVSFAREGIQHALRDPVSGYNVTLQGIVLEWPDLKGPILMKFGQVGLVRNDKEIVTVGKVGLGLSTVRLLTGSIEPVSIRLEGVSLHLIRTEDNKIMLSLEDDSVPEIEGNEGKENPLMQIVNTLSRPEGSIDKRSPIDHLRSVEISNAAMVMEDHVLGISWFLQDIGLTFARDDDGLAVNAEIFLPGGRQGDRASIHANAIYDRFRKDFQISARIRDFDPRIISKKIESLSYLNTHELYLNGEVNVSLDETLKILSASGNIYAENGRLDLQGIYDIPLEFQKLGLDASYDSTSGAANIRDAVLVAHDVEVRVNGAVMQSPGKIDAPLTIKIPHLDQKNIEPLWPAVLKGDPLEAWLLERLSEGSIDNINTKIRIAAFQDQEGWTTDVSDISSDFDIDGMTVDYRFPLSPARKTSGHGHLENDILKISISEAVVDDMSVLGGEVVIDKITSNEVGNAKITVALQSSLPSLFRFIESEPINMKGDDIGIDPAHVKGDATLDIEVSFPTLRDLPKDKVKVKVGGALGNIVLPDIVKDMDLTGGPMKLSVIGGKAFLDGKGKLDGRDVSFAWEQFLESDGKPYSSKIKAQLVADRDLRLKLNIGLDDWLEGAVPVGVVYTEFSDGRGIVNVEGDLKPVTVKVMPFDYSKPPGVAGKVTCSALLHAGSVQEVKKLNVKTPELEVSDGVMYFESAGGINVLRRGNVNRVQLNETDAMLDFEINKAGQLKVGLRGTFFDARPFLKKKRKKGPYDGPAILASVDVAKMRSSDTHVIERAKIYLDLNKQGLVDQLEMDAVAGKGAMYMRLKPDAVRGITSFRLEADDAGAALKAFDVYKNVRGGKIVLVGESAPGKSRYVIQGKAEMSDFNVVNAPALAVLVSAISPTGLPMLLSNDGLYFSRLESRFIWSLRQSGDVYEIAKGRTSGSSLGLTFEGRIDKGTGLVDVNGHVVPMSEINSLISNIPLIGEILTGGSDGGIFAATYTMTGPTEKPEVSVNPLSVLTPGIIRRILFED